MNLMKKHKKNLKSYMKSWLFYNHIPDIENWSEL